ncbi:tetratricopeptide repeat protein [Candidatus Latescibacterota bacterium]
MKRIFIVIPVILVFILIFVKFSYTDPPDIRLEDCVKLMEEGQFEEAKKSLRQYRRTNPDNPRAFFYLAQLEDDFNTALALYKEAEILSVHYNTSEPDSNLAAESVFARAEMNFSCGNLSTAADLCERVINTYPTSNCSCEALYRLGVVHLVSGAPKDALEKFEMCLELDSGGLQRTLASTGVMECYMEMKDWEKALAAARKVLEEEDESSAVTPRAIEVIATTQRELGNEENAAWFTERLLKNYPDSFQAHAIREKGNIIARDSGYAFDSEIAATDSVESNWHAPDNEHVTAVVELSAEDKPLEEKAKFSVQAAALTVRMNTLKLYNKLKDAGFDARIEMKTARSTHYFIVLVGYYTNREEADDIARQVTKVSGDKAIVIALE